MTAFQYCAYGPDGKFAEGVIDAASADAASDLLWAQGLSAFKLAPTRNTQEKWWQRELLGGRKPSRQALPAFTRELATLMTAGIPLDDVLRILSEPTASAEIARIAAELRADVLNGSTLSDAMERRPQIFPADYLSVIRAGEIGGMLGEVIGELADLLDRRMEMRSRVRSALIYPALLSRRRLARRHRRRARPKHRDRVRRQRACAATVHRRRAGAAGELDRDRRGDRGGHRSHSPARLDRAA